MIKAMGVWKRETFYPTDAGYLFYLLDVNVNRFIIDTKYKMPADIFFFF